MQHKRRTLTRQDDDAPPLTSKLDWKRQIRVQLPTGLFVTLAAGANETAVMLLPKIASKVHPGRISLLL